jgi:soluble lytic murein transglycosylase-like protein
VKVDQMTLDEIRKVVVTNNRSTLSNDLIICQIYMESRFDPKAGAAHSARGLMQMQLNAVKQVFKYRKQKLLGRMTSDKETTTAFTKGAAMYKSPSIFDPAINVLLGTEYMQYWLDVSNGDVVAAYKSYRGLDNGVYYRKISASAIKLAANPTSMQPLLDMVK